MSKRLVALLIALLSSGLAKADLNLSPHEETFNLDGVQLTHLIFDNGTDTRTTYQPPTKWSYIGGDNRLQLQPPAKGQAEVSIIKITAQEAIPFDEANHDKLKQKALGSLPDGCTDIKVDSEEINPLRISGRDTYLFELSFTRFGERFRRYYLLLNLANGQLLFQLTSRERDYESLLKDFQHSLYSWQHLT